MSLADFVVESNAIEGIHRDPTEAELRVHERFLALPEIMIGDLENFVRVVTDGRARLRRRIGADARVGGHVAPPGGPHIEVRLRNLLSNVNTGASSAHEAHLAYELLHPFSDGNGRSGRALWAWQMQRGSQDPFHRSFLQQFYYQTLDAAR